MINQNGFVLARGHLLALEGVCGDSILTVDLHPHRMFFMQAVADLDYLLAIAG